MSKILVLSDSHGAVKSMMEAIRSAAPDMVIFLGDCVPDIRQAAAGFPTLDVRYVRGNCDYLLAEPDRLIIEVEGKRLLVAHGHSYGVKQGLLRLYLAAREAGCDVALFGHTHMKHTEWKDGLLLLNPGAQQNGDSALLTIEKSKIII